jgi:hypothetical protein
VSFSSCAREQQGHTGALQAAGDKIFHGETFGGASDDY